jgi:hypothetical protein
MAMQDENTEQAGGQGARVLNDGLAYVHEGELILPAAGSLAQAEQVLDDSMAVIHYYFPVEIEVRAAPERIDQDRIVELTLLRLTQSLRSLRG